MEWPVRAVRDAESPTPPPQDMLLSSAVSPATEHRHTLIELSTFRATGAPVLRPWETDTKRMGLFSHTSLARPPHLVRLSACVYRRICEQTPKHSESASVSLSCVASFFSNCCRCGICGPPDATAVSVVWRTCHAVDEDVVRLGCGLSGQPRYQTHRHEKLQFFFQTSSFP